MKQKLLQLLLNPFIIAGLITGVIIYFMPDYFSKYLVEEVGKESIATTQLVYFEDLDGDGKSEKILAQDFQDQFRENASYLVYKSNGDFVDQFNLNRPFCNERKIMWFKDVNQDGKKEIYIPTRSKDSAYLDVHEGILENKIKHKETFIDVMTPYHGEFDFIFNVPRPFSRFEQFDADLYFTCTNGYSGNPRNVYQYDPISNSVIKSPHITNSGQISELIDIDNDAKNEILLQTNSPGNTIDSIYTTRSDYSTWLTVLDHDLDFLFEPVEFRCLGSLQIVPVEINDGYNLIALLRSTKPNEFASRIIRFTLDGKIEKEKKLSLDLNSSKLFKIEKGFFGIHNLSDNSFKVYNPDLQVLNTYNLESNLGLYSIDIDADNTKEWFGFGDGNQTIHIYRNGFKDKVSANLDFKGIPTSSRFNSGIKQLDKNDNQLFIQKGNTIAYYKYGKNPYYFYQYIVYSGIYGLFLGILLLAVKGQKIVESKKRAIEMEISKLQLKTIKNQVDPHFVFNAINTISEMTLTDNKLEADKFISRFSGFMRDTLKHSDKISTTLKEELEYTENFIRLQQLRFNNSFDYKIEVDSGVNKSTIIPKHVLFTYVENAIKHGIAYTNKGLLRITAIRKPEYLLLSIEDNGGGIQNSDKPKKNSTGSGLKIMDQIFELYTKLYKRKISHKLIELFDENKNKTGIRVEIKISNPKKQK